MELQTVGNKTVAFTAILLPEVITGVDIPLGESGTGQTCHDHTWSSSTFLVLCASSGQISVNYPINCWRWNPFSHEMTHSSPFPVSFSWSNTLKILYNSNP